MTDRIDDGKRDFLRSAALFGTAAAAATGGMFAAGTPQPALAQVMDSFIREDSVLAKIRKAGVLKAGYAQTGPWFYKDARSGELGGIYKDVIENLCKEMQVKTEWVEVTFANSTVGLRRGDFDIFGSSAVYTMQRALVANFIGPVWSKGSLGVIHKDNAAKFKKLEDFNDPGVTFSVTQGASEEARMPQLFPKAKFIATAGQVTLGAEPVRAKRADIWVTGDSDAILFARRNAAWAQVFDVENPFDKRPNTWMIRYGDPEWKAFLDFYAAFLNANGEVERLFKHHMEKLA